MNNENSQASGLDTKFIIVMLIVAAVLVIAAIVVTIIVRRKKSKINIDEEYIKSLVSNLGGKSNVDQIGVDGRKLKVVVNDLSIVNLEEIKALAQAGIFVSGNNIKALFKYDAEELKKGLKTYMKE